MGHQVYCEQVCDDVIVCINQSDGTLGTLLACQGLVVATQHFPCLGSHEAFGWVLSTAGKGAHLGAWGRGKRAVSSACKTCVHKHM